MEQERRNKLLGRVCARLVRYGKCGDPSLIFGAEAVDEVRALLGATDPESDLLAAGAAGWLYWYRYTAQPDGAEQDDLESAARLFAPVFLADPSQVPERLRPVYRRLSDLDEADDIGDAHRAAVALIKRYQHSGDSDAVEEAVRLLRGMVALPMAGAGRSVFLANLSTALHFRYQFEGAAADLTEAIELARQALAVGGRDDPSLCNGLATCLQNQYERTHDLASLDETIDLLRQAVRNCAETDPQISMYLNNLGNALRCRYEASADVEALHEAIRVGRRAVREAVTEELPARLNNLAGALLNCYERTGEVALLDEAAGFARRAVEGEPTTSPSRPRYEINLAHLLRIRFERTADPQSLDDAMSAGRRAVDGTPPGHPRRAATMDDLASVFATAHERTGDLAALNEAIRWRQEALHAAGEAGQQQTRYQVNLAWTLLSGFEASGERSLAGMAGMLALEAVDATTPADEFYAASRNVLGATLIATLDDADHADDAEVAPLRDTVIQVLGRAAVTIPQPHPLRPSILANLALALYRRSRHKSAETDLDRAVDVGRAAVSGSAPDDPARAGRLANVGQFLAHRYRQNGSSKDRHEAAAAFREAAGVAEAPPYQRVLAFREWGRLAVEAGDWATGLTAFGSAVRLLPQVSPRSLARADQEDRLGRLVGLADEAAECAVVLGDPEQAVELLEQGRGVLLAHALPVRGELARLREEEPNLAGQFELLRDRLGAPLSDQSADHWQARRRLVDEWEQLLGYIRSRPGFDRFLAPLQADRAREQAADGAIVLVNLRRRATALVVTGAGVAAVPLPELTGPALYANLVQFHGALSEASDAGRPGARLDALARIRRVLAWLWDALAGPVLEHLGHVGVPAAGEAWPQVWWAASGLLSLLPLHAAGHHDERARPDARTVIDRVVSSYTPTIRALAAARDTPTAPPRPGVLVVAMPTTPGLPALPGALPERDAVAAHCPVTSMVGAAATADAVHRLLPAHDAVHFACHGYSNLDAPSESLLALHDYDTAPLTVHSLAALDLSQARLAYLSACETTRTAPMLSDQAVHLTSACQLAGYSHVVGTLWTVDDRIAARIAEAFYANLAAGDCGELNISCCSKALHDAVRAVRRAYPLVVTLWAAHIHVGA